MFVVGGFDDGLLEGLRWASSDDIVNAVDEAPTAPCSEETWDGVGESVFEGGNDDAASGAWHALHVTEDEG